MYFHSRSFFDVTDEQEQEQEQEQKRWMRWTLPRPRDTGMLLLCTWHFPLLLLLLLFQAPLHSYFLLWITYICQRRHALPKSPCVCVLLDWHLRRRITCSRRTFEEEATCLARLTFEDEDTCLARLTFEEEDTCLARLTMLAPLAWPERLIESLVMRQRV